MICIVLAYQILLYFVLNSVICTPLPQALSTILKATKPIPLKDVLDLHMPNPITDPETKERPVLDHMDATTDKSRQFLLSMYHDLTEGKMEDLISSTALSSQGNTVRSVTAKVISTRLLRGGLTLRSVLQFTLNPSMTSEELSKVELRLPPPNQYQHTIRRIEIKIQSPYRHHLQVFKAKDLDSDSIVLGITKPFVELWEEGAQNVELEFKMKFKNQFLRQTNFGNSGHLPPQILLASPYSGTSDIILAVYTKNNNLISPVAHPLIKQNSSRPETVRGTTRRHVKRHLTFRNKNCERQDFIVDFSEIGWDKYIVYPSKFNAFYCGGRCPGPVEQSYEPTNHAIIQSVVRMKNKSVPRPCCVPTELRPLSMLYYENNELILRHHQDMVVEKCGCR